MCEVRNGRCHTSCVHVPGSILGSDSPHRVANWVLDIVTDRERGRSSTFTTADLQILETREYYDEETGRDVHFGLPDALQQMLAQLQSLEHGEEHGLAAS